MNVDTEALTTIRVIRAQTDPIFTHAPGASLEIVEEPLPDLVMKERQESIPDLSNDEPRRVATWGDTAYHLQESSLRNSIFVRDFRLATSAVFAFEKFTEQHDIETPELPLSWEQLTTSSTEELDELLKHSGTSGADFDEDAVMDTLTKIRHAVAWEQHQIFVEAVYDELPDELTSGVPKAFWQRPDPVLEDIRDGDAESKRSGDRGQSALADF